MAKLFEVREEANNLKPDEKEVKPSRGSYGLALIGLTLTCVVANIFSRSVTSYLAHAFASTFLLQVALEELKERTNDWRKTIVVLGVLLFTAVARSLSRTFYDISEDFPMWQFLVPIIATMHNSKEELYIARRLEASQYAMGDTSWPTNNGNEHKGFSLPRLMADDLAQFDRLSTSHVFVGVVGIGIVLYITGDEYILPQHVILGLIIWLAYRCCISTHGYYSKSSKSSTVTVNFVLPTACNLIAVLSISQLTEQMESLPFAGRILLMEKYYFWKAVVLFFLLLVPVTNTDSHRGLAHIILTEGLSRLGQASNSNSNGRGRGSRESSRSSRNRSPYAQY